MKGLRKMHNSYKKMRYTEARKALANIDKMSFSKRGSRRTHTKFGTFTLYSNKGGRRVYSVSGSAFFHNGGSYTFRSLKSRLLGI
jgi:hypothetical protein